VCLILSFMSYNEVLKKLDRLIEVWIFPILSDLSGFSFTCKFIKNSILVFGYEILSDRIMNEHSITKAVLFFNTLF
jgi:hypothetical protein